MTLEPPWNTFDLPEAVTAATAPSGSGLALSYEGAKAGPFNRAFARAGWDRVAVERGALQTTTTWDRDGWRVFVNTVPQPRTDSLDVRMSIVGIPESERWTELRLPVGPGQIVRDNGRELGVMFDEGDTSTVVGAAIARLIADGWTEGPTRSARTLLTRPDAPTLTVWAEPAGADVLLHLTWGGPPPPVLPPLATPPGPLGTLAELPRAPLTGPWLAFGLPLDDGAVVYSDATTVVVMYERGEVDAQFRRYERAALAGGWSNTFTSHEGETSVASYLRDGAMLTLVVMRAGDFLAVTLTQS